MAIKLEHYSIDPSLLKQEVEIYKLLRGKPGFPRVFWHGYQDDYLAMVFELLGPNLADLLAYCGDRFSLRTTLLLMDQIFKRLKTFHSSGYHHRDIKPENFMLGIGRKGNLVYLTDLGLASFHPVHHVGFHEPKANPKPSLTGTPRFASINGHLGVCKFCTAVNLYSMLISRQQYRPAVMILNQLCTWRYTFCADLFRGKGWRLLVTRRSTVLYWSRKKPSVQMNFAEIYRGSFPFA